MGFEEIRKRARGAPESLRDSAFPLSQAAGPGAAMAPMEALALLRLARYLLSSENPAGRIDLSSCETRVLLKVPRGSTMPQQFASMYDPFAVSINPKFNSANIKATALEIIALEERTGRRYVFGAWGPTQGLTDDQWGGSSAKAQWQKSLDDIPGPIRKALTELVRGNLFSDNPTPMVFRVTRGDVHSIIVSSGQDNSAVPAILVTMVCPI